MNTISFFTEEVSFKLIKKKLLKEWIKSVIHTEGFSLSHLNYIFCSDSYLLNINRQHLNHDYLTDIITFNISDISSHLEGDIFISIDRILDNTSLLNTNFIDELHRVIIHGVLHLIGYDDTTLEKKTLMRNKEDFYLSLRSSELCST